MDPGALPALLGPNRRELAHLIPEARGRTAALDAAEAATTSDDAAADDPFAQVRLFELVLGVIERLARVSPCVLIVEDLQWADPSTRALVAFLVRNLRDERVLLVATVRTDEPDLRHEAIGFLAELERAERVDRIDLARLDRQDLARLIEDELGVVPGAAFVDRTMERTGGNPFYAEQVVAVTGGLDDGELPPRLRDVVLARIALVSEPAQEILRVASAAGSRIDDQLLIEVAERPAPEVREALRDALDRRILVAAGGTGDPHLVFRHALLKEVIHADLFPGERARHHAAFAAALERRAAAEGSATRGSMVSAAELAYHWDAAGDEPRALTASVDAGRVAERGYAWREADRHYRRALELWDRVPDAAAGMTDRAELLARVAATAGVMGDHAEAVRLARRAIAELGPDADPGRAAELHERLRWYLWESGDREAAAAAVAEAERLVPTEPPSATRARILAHHAGILMFTGRFEESIPVATEAHEVARAADSASDEAMALGILGWDLALLGRVDEGIERIRAGVAIAEQLRGAEGIALGATNLATLLDRVGRTADALDVAVAGWERVRALGMERTYGGLLLAIAAKAAIALGRWDDADVYLRDGLAREPAGPAGIRLGVQRGRLATWRGDLAAATTALTTARAIGRGDGRYGGPGGHPGRGGRARGRAGPRDRDARGRRRGSAPGEVGPARPGARDAGCHRTAVRGRPRRISAGEAR